MNAHDDHHGSLDTQFGKYVLLFLWENIAALFIVNLTAVAVTAVATGAGLLLGLWPALILAAFTAYPCFVGLMAVALNRMRGSPESIWGQYWSGIRRSWFTASLLGLVLNGSIYSYLTTAGIYSGIRNDLRWTVLWLAQGVVVLVLALSSVYAFPLMALRTTGLRTTLRNSLLLTAATPTPAFALLALSVALLMPALWVGWGIMLITPIVVAVFWMANCDLQVYRQQTNQ